MSNLSIHNIVYHIRLQPYYPSKLHLPTLMCDLFKFIFFSFFDEKSIANPFSCLTGCLLTTQHWVQRLSLFKSWPSELCSNTAFFKFKFYLFLLIVHYIKKFGGDWIYGVLKGFGMVGGNNIVMLSITIKIKIKIAAVSHWVVKPLTLCTF